MKRRIAAVADPNGHRTGPSEQEIQESLAIS
jgi:hypothetical protein